MTSSGPDASTPIGTPVHLDFRKYDGSEHWQEDYRLLGVDQDGVWLGMRAGTPFARPGMSTHARSDTVRLVRVDARWAACFNAPGGPSAHIYVDIVTPVQWRRTDAGFVGILVDIDLDVVERFDGQLYIDDEDEFEEHTAAFGYPDQLVTDARRAADEVYAAVQQRRPPFDGRGDRWLQRIGDPEVPQD
ncbi:YgaC family protein [Yimella sp. cx-573]|nr:YgaC family protein [Yimella sp. cx-573]